jgi:hypothetical protein
MPVGPISLQYDPSELQGMEDRMSHGCADTTYSSFFQNGNSIRNRKADAIVNSTCRWSPQEFPVLVQRSVQAAGYQRNILPYFIYDKQVDENKYFRYFINFTVKFRVSWDHRPIEYSMKIEILSA